MALSAGEVFAGYTIIRLLGSGGMGEIYLAEHPRLPRQDALKILRSDISADIDYRQRFIREADLAARLWHPNIVRVNDRGEFGGQLWIAMDYVDGTDAARLVRDRFPAGLPVESATTIITAIAKALDYAHQRGLLHRDVKPSNLLLTDNAGDERRVLLSDFGIAREIGEVSGLTATNFTVGTVTYAAPEQLLGEEIDGRADQYALAATAFHLLTGVPPYEASNPVAVISKHLNAPLPSIALIRPDLGPLDPVLAVAMAKRPSDRFTRCTDFAAEFSQEASKLDSSKHFAPTIEAPTAGRPADSPQKPLGQQQGQAPTSNLGKTRRPWQLVASLASVLLLTIATVMFWRPWEHRPPKAEWPTGSAGTNNSVTQVATGSAPSACDVGASLLESMSTRDKLAQLLMVGVSGIADARAVVTEHHVGGINIKSSTDLNMLTDGSLAEIANLGPLPLAVSVDEEGGRVSRLSSLIGLAPSARELASSRTPDEVYQLALARARQMRGLGITVDFAPVVDVTTAPNDTVIGDRSFSADPAVVTAFAGAYARGLRDGGILPVLKHFPGYGAIPRDSHDFEVVTPPLHELLNRDLVPYQILLARSPVGVMLGHLQVPGLTGDMPASLSPAAVNLLRSGGYGGPGFNELIFTDDLFFPRAVRERYTFSDAVLQALKAGVDVVLSLDSSEVPAVLDRLERAVEANELAIPGFEASILRLEATRGANVRCGR